MKMYELAKQYDISNADLLNLADQLGLNQGREKSLKSTSLVPEDASGRLNQMILEFLKKQGQPQTPMLDQYTFDVTEAAKVDPDKYKTIGRNQEIQNVIVSLGRKTKNNPILLGEAGVGKTAIIDGLALEIAQGRASKKLANKHIKVLQIAALGEDNVASKFLKIIEEVKASHGRDILFIDEIHTIMGADTINGAMDLGDVLKPAMGRGEVQLIGSTTLDEFDLFIEKDPALKRRFQEIIVNEPTKAEALQILEGIKDNYEQFHQVKYDPEAIKACVDLSVRYIADRYLPDKAIDLLDQAGASVAFEGKQLVTVEVVAQELQKMTGIPVTSILQSDNHRIRRLKAELSKQVKGQEAAIDQVVDAITIAEAGLQSPTKPLSSFLFLGTTGVGKTELAKALTRVMFDSETNMVRFDMSEFSDKASLKHFQTMITDSIKRKPYCVLLLDEIEKACNPIHDLLLQVLDDGELRDKRGRMINFKNCIFIMTSNLAASLITDKQTYEGVNVDNPRSELAFKKEVHLELTNVFRPEFINRIDHQVVFNILTRDIIKQITIKNLKILNERLAIKQTLRLAYDDDLIDYLADIGTDEENGARPLSRAIEAEITAPISMLLMQQQEQLAKYSQIVAKVEGEGSEYIQNDERHIEFYAE